MRKVLLAGTALVGLVALAAPAHAELKTELGGYFRGYGVYSDNDERPTAAASDSLHQFEFRRDNEIHFNGETTLDNGLTVGAHSEINLGGAGVLNDETYAYFSGGWGRVNFGGEDGSAYLLQVAAPSADSNVDGLRPYISGLNNNVWDNGAVGALTSAAATAGGAITGLALQSFTSYQHADFRQVDRITYLSPKFNGFQAGVSYAPIAARVGGIAGMTTDDDAADFDNLWEAAARWDGEFSGVGISAGGGYSAASTETKAAAGAAFSDDLQTWNAGVNLTWTGFSLGAGYHTTNNGFTAVTGGSDTDTWTVGLGWDNGPYHLGGNWLHSTADAGLHLLDNATGGANTAGKAKLDAYTLGGGYTYGPGMTFRGAFKWGTAKNGEAVAANRVETNFSQGTIGTDIQF